jgi:hypothetical protein
MVNMAHVWYRKNDIGNTEPLLLDNYSYVGEIPYDHPEAVFRAMNHVDGSEIESHLRGFGVRSMSVGDIAITEEGSFLCDNAGWINMMDDPKLKEFLLALTIFGERGNSEEAQR